MAEAKILVVEDNFINRELMQEMLHFLKVQPTVVESGLKALVLLEQEPFDLIFMDLQMPEIDGYETVRRIRHHKSISPLPIVALTATSLKEDLDKCSQAGMNGFLLKPFTLEELEKSLKTHLKATV